ncbi:hypothetical protein BO70DRAFT_358123 [Aspergillus heteromorphus CBS 117.55]|uniref:Uncharacterized protein n=1 Tax=Aspergillus heteromorphus CBS 117.55 TaxID=1448321 RepID=A0A317WWH3_9EURO|nr:uncharacterized protein BO70DRAFT_358123 [Aspergillus heteromorphus CBS 117.55]PWY90673.1 hypothetical protein BO70DRAFT_358123 [Aspergillus heteromorphus CBS 117.55]
MLDAEERQIGIGLAKQTFDEEFGALLATQSLRCTPTMFGHWIDEQKLVHEYSGGYLHNIAMEKMPGIPAHEYRDLGRDEQELIKAALISMLGRLFFGYPDRTLCHNTAMPGPFPNYEYL